MKPTSLLTRAEWEAYRAAARKSGAPREGRTAYLVDRHFAIGSARPVMNDAERAEYDSRIVPQKVALDRTVILPEVFPEFPVAGHRALVVDRDGLGGGQYWILELSCDPEPGEYGENTMLWPVQDNRLTVTEDWVPDLPDFSSDDSQRVT